MAKSKKSGWTLFALGLGYFIDQGEIATIGVLQDAMMRFWNATRTLPIGRTEIGMMETLRTILMTFSAPLWGYAADRFSRKNVLIFGTGVWGVWTILIGLMPSFEAIAIMRVISGLGLGCLMPATFSLLGDHYAQSSRGKALGVIGFVGLMGTVIGTVMLGFVASEQLWRWGFVGLGAASVISGLVIWLAVEEPLRGAAEPELKGVLTEETAKHYQILNWKDVFETLRTPTIWAAILQGISGTMPWVVMSLYLIPWMNTELGFSMETDFSNLTNSAPLVFGILGIGAAISNYAGGVIGDFAERVSPKYGRTVIGQVSVFSGVPLMYIFLMNAPQMTFGQIMGLAFLTSLLIGWPGRGAKEPMMQAVVLPEKRSSAYSVVNMIEGGLSAFAAVIAGSLADRLGLTRALLWTIPFPWLLCTILFSLFYFTYPRDFARVRAKLAARREELLAQGLAPAPEAAQEDQAAADRLSWT
ncbi:MAG TPA: MFS transporter [Anaerolineaceae bacterium]|nr:MFS transporter [Anaerolineaceae bacterium]